MSTTDRPHVDRVIKHFGIDPDPEIISDIPDFIFEFVAKLVRKLPDETEILIEAAELDGDPMRGGNGYGVATCVEENCMKDIPLIPDPDLPDGGLSNGLGSIAPLEMHCMEESHRLAKEKRKRQEKRKEEKIQKEGSLAEFGSRPSMAQLEKAASQSQVIQDFSDTEDEDAANDRPVRPRWATIGTDGESGWSDTDVEDEEVKPIIASTTYKGKGKARADDHNPIVLSSDEDDFPIRPIGIKRKQPLFPTSSIGSDPASAIPIDSDDDMDVKPVFSSPARSAPRKQKQTRLDRFYSGGGGKVKDELSVGGVVKTDVKPPIELPHQPVPSTSSYPGYPLDHVPPPAYDARPIDQKPYINAQGDIKPNVDDIAGSRPWSRPPAFNPVPTGRYYDKEQARTRLFAEKECLQRLSSNPTAAAGLKPLVEKRLRELNDIVLKNFQHSVKPWIPFPSRTVLERIPGLATIWSDVTEMYLKRDESERLRVQAEHAAAIARAQALPVNDVPGLSQSHNAEAGPSEYRAPAGAMITAGAQPNYGLPRNVSLNEYNSVAPPGLPVREDEMAKFFEDALKGFAEDESVASAATKLGLASMNEILPSMKVTLMPHQVIGVAWMLDMERNAARKGGILADSMGLGKTIQMIATMAENPSNDKKHKTTLVIAPVALLNQWEEEIRRFVKDKWRIHVYHGKGAKISLAQLKHCDVVLTSFGQVTGALPSTKGNPNDGSDTDLERKGDLLRMKWYRVCVDEASFIRNSKTKSAKAVYQLRSELRWILSGTLVVNSLVDLYSPFHFLNISELAIWDNFRNKIKRLEKRRPDLAIKRIQAVLKYACKRRTADSRIDGQPILTLPEKITVKRIAVFDTDEQSVYDIIEARAIARFNKLLKANSVLKNYAHVLTMILRLRQICNSVSLVVRKPGEAPHPNDLLISNADMTFNPKATEEPTWNKETEIERARQVGGDELVNKLIIKYQERQTELDDADKAGDQAEDELANVDMECGVCFEPFGDDERVTTCCHSFCTTCIELVIRPTVPGAVAACPFCREPLHAGKVFVAAAFKPADEVKEEDLGDGLMEDVKTELNLDEKMPPSTKMVKSLELVQGWLAAGPTDKVIIFSQFVAMIDLLDDYFRENGIDVATYTGQMSKDDRDDVIADFKRPEGPSVIIISTKAGGVGLNLTCANKVILMDHTWTYAATAQAVDRAWRIGQTKPVEVIELSIEKTIEERILALQERKKALADGAFGEGNGQKLGRLSLADLRMLFDRNA